MRDSFYGPPPPTLMQGPIPFQPTITLAGAAAAKGPIPKPIHIISPFDHG